MKRFSSILIGLGLLLSAPLFSQPQIKSLLGVEDAAMIEKLMPIVPGVSRMGGAVNINQQSVKAYMMPARNVESNGSEESYLLASCLEYYVNLDKNYKVNLSPDYISLNLRNQGKRIDFKGAFQQMSETGTVSAAIMPYGSNTITSAVYATQKFKILNYLVLFREMTRERQKIFELRKALLRGNPVIVEVKSDASVRRAYGKELLDLSTRGEELFAFIVVGFDEEKEMFEVMSPWGSNWGRGGYQWISYEDLARQSFAAYVMVPAETF